MPNFWVATVSAEHALRGRDLGILQVNHGKSSPLSRMRPGDGVVIYSPRESYPDGATLQAFTVIGKVAEGGVYQGEMGAGFKPFRRDMIWDQAAKPIPIRPLLDQLEVTQGLPNWGMVFRFGLRALPAADFDRIAHAMGLVG